MKHGTTVVAVTDGNGEKFVMPPPREGEVRTVRLSEDGKSWSIDVVVSARGER